MPQYRTWIDPRAAMVRAEMRRSTPRDICSKTLRLSLHLSDVEHSYLVAMNPQLNDEAGPAWARFIAHPDSEPFRVNKV